MTEEKKKKRLTLRKGSNIFSPARLQESQLHQCRINKTLISVVVKYRWGERAQHEGRGEEVQSVLKCV